jgi:hypothetical protein
MFWPSIDVARRVSFSGDEVWARGPRYGDLLIALRPALRALFLQGYRTDRISIGVKSSGSGPVQWGVIDLESFELRKVAARYPSVTTSLDVVFETTAMNDRRGVAAPEGYGMTGVTTRIGMDGALEANGKVPQALTRSIDAFVDAAVVKLEALVRNRAVPRSNHQGLLWIFDPQHFRELDTTARDVVQLAFQTFINDTEQAIREQVTDRRIEANASPDGDRPPNLRWLTIATVYIDPFWLGVRTALERRGESERLTMATEARLSSENAASWLDVIVELLRLGAIDMDALIEAVEPVEPLVATRVPATDQLPETIELRIWGESTIKLFRVTSTVNPRVDGGIMTGVDGAVAWEYVRNPGDRPRVVIVASRGICVAPSEYTSSFPWFLDIYRVQDDALVPAVGATIEPSAFLGASIIEPRAGELSANFHASRTRLVVRGKKDGLFFEYPMQATSGQDRFALELTLDNPCSGYDGYIVDVHFYDLPVANGPYGVGIHVCVWATDGVTVESNGTPVERKRGAATTFFEPGWTASAEFWQLDSIQHILYPFSGLLSITPRLAYHDDRISARVPRFPDNLTLQRAYERPGGDFFVHLTPKYYTPKSYDDSWAYLVIDFVVGLIPGIGDLADAAELTIAWTTGLDKWGRPVSNYELAFMTAATFVPFIGAGFAKGVGGAIEGAAGEVFRGEELIAFFRRFAPGVGQAPAAADVERLASVSHSWWTGANWRDTARADAQRALVDFLRQASPAVEAFARRMANETGDAWFTLDDIYNASTDGFHINALNIAYRRWQGDTNGGRDPHTFLQSLNNRGTVSGTAKIVADALLGPEAVSQGARYIPQGGRFPSLSRPEINGPNHLLSDIDFSAAPPPARREMNFHVAVEGFVEAALSPGSSVRVVEAYALRAAGDIVEEADRAFLGDATRRLMDSVPGDAIREVVGNDRIGGWNLTLPERAARCGTALLVACAEMRSKLLDPAWLLNPELLPELRVFVRDFISRKGAEIGMRFELSKAAAYFHELARHPNVEAIRTQLRMPLVDGLATYVQQGPDIVLYLLDPINKLRRAVFVQLKAYTDLSRLARGPVRIRRDPVTNAIIGVEGPDFLEQAVSDALRIIHPEWEGSVPGPGELEDVPGDVVDWVRTANVHVLQFDDVLIRDMVFQLVMEARTRTGLNTIRAADINPPNESVRDVFAQMFPNGLTANSTEQIYQHVHRESLWLDQWALETERWINNWMLENFDEEYDETVRFIVRRGNIDANDIVRDVLAMMPGLE